MSKYAVGEFPTKRILAIAACDKVFLVDKYSPKHRARNNRCKKLVKEGYLTNNGTEGHMRHYHITEKGKEHLKELQAKKVDGLTNVAPHI